MDKELRDYLLVDGLILILIALVAGIRTAVVMFLLQATYIFWQVRQGKDKV